MKIQGPGALNATRGVGSYNSMGRARGLGPDETKLSTVASAMAEMKSPEIIDQTRVDRLKLAIENGSFEVDPDRIATRMLEEESG